VISCPKCGEDDRLSGRRVDGVITVTCGACGHTWERSTAPACPTCGGADLLAVEKAVVERSRGTQRSVVGTVPGYLCRACDADGIDRLAEHPGNRLVMPDELPTDLET